MSIIGSCGHQVESFEELHQISTKAWDITEEGWVKAIHYSSVCQSCKEDYEKEGYVLKTTEEEYAWLRGEVNEADQVS